MSKYYFYYYLKTIIQYFIDKKITPYAILMILI